MISEFSSWFNKDPFYIGSFDTEIRGSIVNISVSKALRLLSSPERELRKNTFKGFMGALERQGNILLDTLNALVQENNKESHSRGHPSSFHMYMIRNDIEPTLAEGMIKTVEENYSIVSRYYSLKSRLTLIDDFKIFDISAPIRKHPMSFPIP